MAAFLCVSALQGLVVAQGQAAETTLSSAQDCAALAGAWDPSTSTCAIDTLTLDAGSTLVIPPGVIVEIHTGLENAGDVHNRGQITNLGTIDTSGTVTNEPPSSFSNLGTLNIEGGQFLVSSTITDLSDVFSSLTNTGTINLDSGTLYIDEFSILTNDGVIDHNAGDIRNFGTLINTVGGTLTSSGQIANFGTLTNYGTCDIISPGNVFNVGQITNAGALDNGGTIDLMSVGGLLTNSGALTNTGTIDLTNLATLSNSGSFANPGTLSISINPQILIGNGGHIVNSGSLTNSGVLGLTGPTDEPTCSECTATLENSGDMTNAGAGVVSSTNGFITNDAGGTITNLATIVNDHGELTNAGTLTNTASATLVNDGSIINIGAGTFTNSGFLTGNDIVFLPPGATTFTRFTTDTLITADRVVSSGEAWVIDPGVILTIPSGVTLTVDGTLANAGILRNAGTLSNGGTCQNAGTVDNYASFINTAAGTLINEVHAYVKSESAATFTNFGTITNLYGFFTYGFLANAGTITNHGGHLPGQNGTSDLFVALLLNAGNLVNASAATISNGPDATVENVAGGAITNSGTIANSDFIESGGALINTSDGKITNAVASILNNNPPGIVNNEGVIDNDGGLGVYPPPLDFVGDNAGLLENAGIINNHSGAVLANGWKTVIANTGTLNNEGDISTDGDIVSSGLINSTGTIYICFGSPHCTLTNDGTLESSGTLAVNDDHGVLINTGNLDSTGLLINDGGITNTGTGIFTIAGSLFFSEMAPGSTFANLGSLTFDSAAVVMSGTLTNSGIISIGSYVLSTRPGEGNVMNGGTINIAARGVLGIGRILSNSGTLRNGGFLVTAGTFSNDGLLVNAAWMEMRGTLTNSGSTNSGSILNEASATLLNFAPFDVTDGGTVSNAGLIANRILDFSSPIAGSVSNSGAITNVGTIENSGGTFNNVRTLDNSGTIESVPMVIPNKDGSTTVVPAELANSGILTNPGTIDNGGALNNPGAIRNYGTIRDECGATFSGNAPTGNPVYAACGGMTVHVDIKPGSDVNPINPGTTGTTTVAVLGSGAFDVKTIKVAPLDAAPRFGGMTPERPKRVEYEDVNSDGFIDLVLQYSTAGLTFAPGSTQGCISGRLGDGTPIFGCDSVVIVGGP